MLRSMMQVFVHGSEDALQMYQKAFDAEVLCAYPNETGGYMHAELNAYGQVLAVSEADEEVCEGGTMMFCFHFGEGGEEKVYKAYEVLKENARSAAPPAPCEYSPCQCVVMDCFGVYWCLFV